ncbi:unnamed protein product [Orchesella dallaii]|uniref:Uncharacterized protein n=1 Tax=Orchesella dallaii TaxID=48710 RepID=A0ABP1R0T1_9HEXA
MERKHLSSMEQRMLEWIKPTNFYGGECGAISPATHFINNCNYHGSNIGMNHLLGGSLASPASSAAGQLLQFDQTEFGGSNVSSMDNTGYVYIPTGCQDKTTQCKLHIAFHGGVQSKYGSESRTSNISLNYG